MILLIVATLTGGLLTVSLLASYSLVLALLAAPVGAAVCTMTAAVFLARRRSVKAHSPLDLDEQADTMVATLSGALAQAKRGSEASGRRASDDRKSRAA